MFWFVFALFLCAAVLLIARPFYGLRAGNDAKRQIQSLQDELKSVDEQELPDEERDAARADIAKRLMAAEEATKHDVQSLSKADRTLFLSLGLILILASGGLYAFLGSPTLLKPKSEKPIVDLTTPVQSQSQKREEALAKLNKHLAENPDDVDAWRMLGWADMQEGNFEGAVAAYRKAVALTPKDSETVSSLGEALAMAAQGQITPEAKKLFETSVSLNPNDSRALFYLGLAKKQAGNQQGALDDWTKLLRASPANAPFRPMLEKEVAELSKQLGQPLPKDISPTPKGPSAEDIKAVQQMSPEQRQQMIEGMVSQLETRLQDNPKDLQGWEQLIRSLVVLKHKDRADKALASARAAFKDDQGALAQLDLVAKSQGL